MSDCEKTTCDYKSILDVTDLEKRIKVYFTVPFQYRLMFKQYDETKFIYEKKLWCITTYTKEQFKNTMKLAQLFEPEEVEYEFGNPEIERDIRISLKTIYSLGTVTRILKFNCFNKVLKKIT